MQANGALTSVGVVAPANLALSKPDVVIADVYVSPQQHLGKFTAIHSAALTGCCRAN